MSFRIQANKTSNIFCDLNKIINVRITCYSNYFSRNHIRKRDILKDENDKGQPAASIIFAIIMIFLE